MGIKYVKGYGVDVDTLLSDSLMELSAKNGFHEAIYTWGRRLEEKGMDIEAVTELNKICRSDYRAAEWLERMFQTIDPNMEKIYYSSFASLLTRHF